MLNAGAPHGHPRAAWHRLPHTVLNCAGPHLLLQGICHEGGLDQGVQAFHLDGCVRLRDWQLGLSGWGSERGGPLRIPGVGQASGSGRDCRAAGLWLPRLTGHWLAKGARRLLPLQNSAVTVPGCRVRQALLPVVFREQAQPAGCSSAQAA